MLDTRLIPSADSLDPVDAGPTNRLLSSLSADDAHQLQELGSLVRIEQRSVLTRVGEPLRHVWFPVSGILSLIAVMQDGTSVETVSVGRDGLLGAPWLAEAQPIAGAGAVAPVTSIALRIPIEPFKELMDSHPDLSHKVLQFTDGLFRLTAQNAACNRLHPAGQSLPAGFWCARTPPKPMSCY